MKIVVLAGGLSTERQVSLTSGTGVCRALRERGHQAILVDMFLGLEDYNGSLADIFDAPDSLCGDNRVLSTAPDLEAVRRSRRDQGPSLLGKDVLTVCAMADLVFLALHGSCGEDGRIQATLDLLGVPYTGSGYLGSGMAMDKSVTKRIMDAAGVPTAPWHDVRYTREDIPRLARELPVPCAVKIINGGSSIGVELPDTREELAQTLERMLAYGNNVIVEKKIRAGRSRWPFWATPTSPPWRSSPGGPISTISASIRRTAPRRSALPPSPRSSGAPWASWPCACTGPWTWASIPGRTSFWMRRGTSGAWRSTPCPA